MPVAILLLEKRSFMDFFLCVEKSRFLLICYDKKGKIEKTNHRKSSFNNYLSHICIERKRKEGTLMLKELREEKILLSLNEVSELLNISYGKARTFTFEQNMQVRIGRRILVHRAKLIKWLERQVN